MTTRGLRPTEDATLMAEPEVGLVSEETTSAGAPAVGSEPPTVIEGAGLADLDLLKAWVTLLRADFTNCLTLVRLEGILS